MEVRPVDELKDMVGDEQVYNRRHSEVFEISHKRALHISAHAYQEILGVSYGAERAPERSGEAERQEEERMRDIVLFREIQDKRRAYDSEGVVHQDCGKEAEH